MPADQIALMTAAKKTRYHLSDFCLNSVDSAQEFRFLSIIQRVLNEACQLKFDAQCIISPLK